MYREYYLIEYYIINKKYFNNYNRETTITIQLRNTVGQH